MKPTSREVDVELHFVGKVKITKLSEQSLQEREIQENAFTKQKELEEVSNALLITFVIILILLFYHPLFYLLAHIYHGLATKAPPWKEAIFMNPISMAKYADPVIRYYTFTNNEEQLLEFSQTKDGWMQYRYGATQNFAFWGSDELCNIAYVALYGPGKSKDVYKTLWSDFVKYKARYWVVFNAFDQNPTYDFDKQCEI